LTAYKRFQWIVSRSESFRDNHLDSFFPLKAVFFFAEVEFTGADQSPFGFCRGIKEVFRTVLLFLSRGAFLKYRYPSLCDALNVTR